MKGVDFLENPFKGVSLPSFGKVNASGIGFTNNPIIERREEPVRLCKKNKIDILYAFGRQVKEIYRFMDGTGAISIPGSRDVDIGILVKTPKSVDDKVNLVIDLEDYFQVGCEDLVSLAESDPFRYLCYNTPNLLFNAPQNAIL
jgi:hypothetical protein